MATFPAYVKLHYELSEQPSPVVERSEVERGIAKQRRIAADAVVRVPLVLMFDSTADALAFETWFYTEIGGGADWFDWLNTKTGAVVQARFVGGDIGTLQSGGMGWREESRRAVTLEYVRSAL